MYSVSKVKILAQRLTHISAVATLLLITKTFTERETDSVWCEMEVIRIKRISSRVNFYHTRWAHRAL